MSAHQAFFITGTDTEVGKTFVTCELLRGFVAQGKRAVAMKPVASGCRVLADGSLENDDVVAHRLASNVIAPAHILNPYAFEPPVSPHIAAMQAGVSIDFGTIATAFSDLQTRADIVLLEAAGGWLAPIDDARTMADLAAFLAIPVILVVGVRLGCLNHAMLTIESIKSRGIPLAGWVANCISPDMLSLQHNLDYLIEHIPAHYFGAVPHGGCGQNPLKINS